MTPPDRARLKARNLELFRRCTVESVYRRLTSLEPKWELVFDEDGTPDLMADRKSVLRPDPADADYPPNFAPGSIIRFTATPPDRDRIDVHTFRFLDATLNRAAAEGITFYDQPTTSDTFYLVIFGIGLGRHIRPLIEQTNGLNVILVEPDIEFLWHSLEVCDWIDLDDVKAGDPRGIVRIQVAVKQHHARRRQPCRQKNEKPDHAEHDGAHDRQAYRA